MERVLIPRPHDTALITPAHHGWRLRHDRPAGKRLRANAARATTGSRGAFPGADGESVRVFTTLGEAAEESPGENIHLALPADAVLFERMRLPSKDHAELSGMVRLQLEKTLPFSADEITSDFQVIEQGENDSLLLAFAANHEQLDAICEPLREAERWPEKVTVFAVHVAAAAPKNETVCAIFREQESVVLAIVENAKLAFAETVVAEDADAFFSEVAHILLSAELVGVPTSFSRVLLDSALSDWQETTREVFSTILVEFISLDAPLPEPPMNLLPPAWAHERARLERIEHQRNRIILAGIVYLALILCAAGWVLFLRHRLGVMDREVAAAQPLMDFITSRRNRWEALAPAIDPHRYTVETLYQISKSTPSDTLRLTLFDATPTQFMVEGEAPTANLAVDFGERLKNNPDLKQFKFQISPPTILPNEHAQFRIFGKL